jgi:hypothetical protein
LPAGAASAAYAPFVLGREVTRGPLDGDGVGTLVAGAIVSIVDVNGEALPRGTIGRVSACGVVTGDLGWIGDGDALHLAGTPARATVVPVRGELIDLQRVRAVLLSVPGVIDAGVLAFPDARGELQLAAYYSGTATIAEVRAGTKQRLAGEEWPLSVDRVETLTFSADGLLDADATPLPQWMASQAPAPESERELQVAQIFERVLSVQVRTVDDDFFLLGGDSMLAVKLVDELWRAGLKIALADLRGSSTVAALATKLENKARD